MDIEDEILEELQDKERLIAGQEKLINEKNRSLAEKDKALAEREKQIVIKMGRSGSEISFISQITGLNIDEIMKILEENVEE